MKEIILLVTTAWLAGCSTQDNTRLAAGSSPGVQSGTGQENAVPVTGRTVGETNIQTSPKATTNSVETGKGAFEVQNLDGTPCETSPDGTGTKPSP